MDYRIKRSATGYEIETTIEEENLDGTYLKLERIWARLSQLDEKNEPKRRLLNLENECEKYWIKRNGELSISREVTVASQCVALSVLEGGNMGKNLTQIASESGLKRGHVHHLLSGRISYTQEWFHKDERKLWTLTLIGIEKIAKTILPYLQDRHGNEFFKILKWLDKQIFTGQYDSWLTGKIQTKIAKLDTLEYSIGLLLSSLGFHVYQVGMYSGHFDIVAFSDDGPTTLLCECTSGMVRKKTSSLNIAIDEFKNKFSEYHVEGIVFTTEKISKTDRKDLLTDRIRIVDISQIRELLKLSKTDRRPELLFDVIRRREIS